MSQNAIHCALTKGFMNKFGNWDPFTLLDFSPVDWLSSYIFHLNTLNEVKGYHTIDYSLHLYKLLFIYLVSSKLQMCFFLDFSQSALNRSLLFVDFALRKI